MTAARTISKALRRSGLEAAVTTHATCYTLSKSQNTIGRHGGFQRIRENPDRSSGLKLPDFVPQGLEVGIGEGELCDRILASDLNGMS